MDEINQAIQASISDGVYRKVPAPRNVNGRVASDQELHDLRARVRPIAGAYVQLIRAGDKDEVDQLRRVFDNRRVPYEVAWDATKLRQELGYGEGDVIRALDPQMPEQQAVDPAFAPVGEGSTASGAPAMEAAPGHGATASGTAESFDPGFGATTSGSVGTAPEEGWVMPPAWSDEPTTAPVNRDIPMVSGPDGLTASVGQVVNCTMGNWENEVTTYTYQWMRDDVKVGIGQSTYLVVAADNGHNLTCVVGALNKLGYTEAPPSNALAITAAPADAPSAAAAPPQRAAPAAPPARPAPSQVGASAPPVRPTAQTQPQPPQPPPQPPREQPIQRPAPEGTTPLTRPTSDARPAPGTGQRPSAPLQQAAAPAPASDRDHEAPRSAPPTQPVQRPGRGPAAPRRE